MAEYELAPDEETVLRVERVPHMTIRELREQIHSLRECLANLQKPTNAELIDYGRAVHPWYAQRTALAERITKLQQILAAVGQGDGS